MTLNDPYSDSKDVLFLNVDLTYATLTAAYVA